MNLLNWYRTRRRNQMLVDLAGVTAKFEYLTEHPEYADPNSYEMGNLLLEIARLKCKLDLAC